MSKANLSFLFNEPETLMPETKQTYDYLDSPDYLGLLDAIKEAPDDDAPRLMITDVLEEHGHIEQAQYIREEIAWANGPHSDIAGRSPPPQTIDALRSKGLSLTPSAFGSGGWYSLFSYVMVPTARVERSISTHFDGSLLEGMPPNPTSISIARVCIKLSRGFVEGIAGHREGIMLCLKNLFQWHPIRFVFDVGAIPLRPELPRETERSLRNSLALQYFGPWFNRSGPLYLWCRGMPGVQQHGYTGPILPFDVFNRLPSPNFTHMGNEYKVHDSTESALNALSDDYFLMGLLLSDQLGKGHSVGKLPKNLYELGGIRAVMDQRNRLSERMAEFPGSLRNDAPRYWSWPYTITTDNTNPPE